MTAPHTSAEALSPHAPAWVGEFVLLSSLWGASFLFMRLGAAEFGPLPMAGLRVLMAALFLWPFLLHRGEWPALRRHWRPVLFAGLINSAIPFALFAWAVMHIATGLTSILKALFALSIDELSTKGRCDELRRRNPVFEPCQEPLPGQIVGQVLGGDATQLAIQPALEA